MEDKYIKLRTIGRGAYGTVCLCERVTDRRPVIIKQIPVETMSIEERQAALNEVKVLEMLQVPPMRWPPFWYRRRMLELLC